MSGDLPLSATELSGFSECQHLTWLNAGVARGERELPGRNELERWMLEHRGRAHEARLLDWYRRQGKQVVELSPAPVRDEAALARAVEATWAALEQGAEVVYQGTLRHEGWTGRPDFLMQVPGKSRLGSFHYEVLDAKLARHAQARSILQLCVYTEQLGALQGRLPERFWVAIGGSSPSGSSDDGLAPLPPIECRTHDYLAYYRRTRGRFERFVAEAERVAEPYPEPVEHCDVCRWWKHCESRRRADDHVSLVAGSTRRQRDRLARVGVATATQLAQLAPAQAVTGIDAAPLERLREQARLQLAGREAGRVLHELLLGGEPGTGLERLPLPTPGDLFLDLEGDAYALGDGLEYLFGLVELGEPSLGWSSRTEPGPPRYLAHWAQNRAEEKRAFEAVIRRIERGLLEFPGLHVFHFGQRESDALRRLSCRHASMELQVDRLLREHVLVDLHTVVKQSLRASVESYTLKQLEGLYGFTRALEPRRAALSMQRYGFWLETGEALSDLEEERRVLERYNAEDCHSAWQLRGWLEQRRTERELSEGRPLNRPSAAAAEQQQESRKERSKDATLAVEQLQTGLPEDAAQDTPEQRGKRVLGHLVGWHWREQKSAWWEYYRATELAPSERLEDRAVLDGLEFEKIAGKVARSQLFRYRFPEQEHPRRGPWRDPDSNKNVDVVALGASHVDIKRGAKLAKEAHPRSLIPTPIDSAAQEKSVLSIAQSVARHGLSGTKRGVEAFPAARALLLRQPPRCGQAEGAPLLPEAADTVSGVVSLVLALEPGVLAVQGPPGSGKTHRAAAAIVALLRAGKRVGITANSHQVITDLLGKCCARARAEGLAVGAHHIDKVTEPLVREGEADAARVLAEELLAEKEAELYSEHDDHEAVAAGLRDGSLQLVGATSYAWARELYQGSLDVLVVDEAAQISLANVIAVSPAAPRLILFGDPAQLEQPQRGVHPPGADVSALEYLLGDALTMPAALGVFLAETRRLHPELCKFTSQVFYEGRLHALPGLEQQRIVHVGASELRLTGLAGSGLRFVPTPHRGNTHRSEEEVQQVAQLVKELLGGGYRFVTAEGVERTLEPRDVLVVAPYNAQVAALRQSLPANVAVGTVDKFQGREAPVVIYSLTSSSAADAPRGFEFLYSLNRLNVATSRAQALVILVASPELAQAHCRSPRQMQLVNALCTFLELVSGLAE